MAKPHLRMIKGRVFQFESRKIAARWVEVFGASAIRKHGESSPKTFREWKERKVENARRTVKVEGVRRANEAIARNRIIDWIFKDFFSCVK